MEDAHAKKVEEVLSYFSVDQDRGLTPEQVKRYQEKYGPNGEFFSTLTKYFYDVCTECLHTVSFVEFEIFAIL